MTLNEKFSDLPVKSLLEISNDEPAVVIGIFFKKYKKQDQILNEYREDGDDTITDGDENDMKLITGLFTTWIQSIQLFLGYIQGNLKIIESPLAISP